MRYEDGRPEPDSTTRDIYGAWVLAGIIFLIMALWSFA
jgi:hypothetical protein